MQWIDQLAPDKKLFSYFWTNFKKINYFKLQLINKWQMTVVCRPSKLITSASSFQRCVQNSNGRLTSWGLGRLGVFGKKKRLPICPFSIVNHLLWSWSRAMSPKAKKIFWFWNFMVRSESILKYVRRTYFLFPNFIEKLN